MQQLYIARPTVAQSANPNMPTFDYADGRTALVVLTADDVAALSWWRRAHVKLANYFSRICWAVFGLPTLQEETLYELGARVRQEAELRAIVTRKAEAWAAAEFERIEAFAKFSDDPQLRGLVADAKRASAAQRDKVLQLEQLITDAIEVAEDQDRIIEEICDVAGVALSTANPMGEPWRCPEFAKLADTVRRYT